MNPSRVVGHSNQAIVAVAHWEFFALRKLILKMSMSVDGFVGGPKGELDCLKGLDAPASEWLVEKLWDAGVHIMGRPTFEVMSAYWPGSSAPFAPPMNDIPKIYFSRTPANAAVQAENMRDNSSPQLKSWIEAKLASGNLAEEIASLKAKPGKPILAHGGAGFGRSLIESGLVDEFQLVVHPVAIGRGLAIFESLPRPMPLKLVSSSAFQGGVVANIYQVT
jgi:dihydrofolate reductase